MFLKIFKPWLMLLILFALNRLAFIACFNPTGFQSLLRMENLYTLTLIMFQGFRFDLTWAASIGLILGFSNQKIRVLIFSVVILICFIANRFYSEYHDVFNPIIFNLFVDDFTAILITAVKQYHLLPGLALSGTVGWICAHFVQSNPGSVVPGGRKSQILKLGILIACLILSFRGGIGRRPIQLKDAAVTDNLVFNQAVVNPVSALRYAIKDRIKIWKEGGLQQWLAKAVHPSQVFQAALNRLNLQPDLLRISDSTAPKLKQKPRHIFLIMMESQDLWPLLPAYEALDLGSGLKSLMYSSKGIHTRSFISASIGTIGSLASVITGLSDPRVTVHHQASSYQPYSSSIALQFKRLGYQTNLFYGGYLSWQSLGTFAKNQGFDHVFGAGHMGSWWVGNEWGVADHELFQFIQDHLHSVSHSTSSPFSFNLIMTVSNHPPYSVPLEDLKRQGFHAEKMEQLLKEKYPHSQATLKNLSHYWYADKAVTDFVHQMESLYPDSLFIITADHYSRKHLLPGADRYETSAVPLIIYGNGVDERWQTLLEQQAGSHIDMVPTIFELIAQPGFHYHALGRNLLMKNKQPLGIGYQSLMLPDQTAASMDTEPYKTIHRDYHLISACHVLSAQCTPSDSLNPRN